MIDWLKVIGCIGIPTLLIAFFQGEAGFTSARLIEILLVFAMAILMNMESKSQKRGKTK